GAVLSAHACNSCYGATTFLDDGRTVGMCIKPRNLFNNGPSEARGDILPITYACLGTCAWLRRSIPRGRTSCPDPAYLLILAFNVDACHCSNYAPGERSSGLTDVIRLYCNAFCHTSLPSRF